MRVFESTRSDFYTDDVTAVLQGICRRRAVLHRDGAVELVQVGERRYVAERHLHQQLLALKPAGQRDEVARYERAAAARRPELAGLVSGASRPGVSVRGAGLAPSSDR